MSVSRLSFVFVEGAVLSSRAVRDYVAMSSGSL